MENEPHLAKMFQARKVEFSFQELFGQVELSIQIPDLTLNRYSVSGDWGPNYEINLDPLNPVKVALKRGQEDLGSYCLEMKTVSFKSPMLKYDRDQFPLYLELDDVARDVVYQIFMDYEGIARRVKVNDQTIFL